MNGLAGEASATRRTVLQGATAAALMAYGARAQGAPKPNIVFFLADDLGYADVSCYGRPDISTPNIDRIAAQGVRFTQAYANSAVCSATRTALITGRYQYRLAVGLEEPIAASSKNVGMPPGHPTLPSLLRQAGYGTTLLGKWHLGSLPDYSPLRSGYDHFWGFHGGALDYFAHTGTGHDPDLWDGDLPVVQTGYMTDLIGDRAVSAVNAFALALALFLGCAYLQLPQWTGQAPPYVPMFMVVSLCLAAFILALSQARSGRFINPIAASLGKVSFSAYLLHFAVIQLTVASHPSAFHADAVGVGAIAAFAAAWVAVVALTAAAAWCSYRALELPMMTLGRNFSRSLQAGKAGRALKLPMVIEQ